MIGVVLYQVVLEIDTLVVLASVYDMLNRVPGSVEELSLAEQLSSLVMAQGMRRAVDEIGPPKSFHSSIPMRNDFFAKSISPVQDSGAVHGVARPGDAHFEKQEVWFFEELADLEMGKRVHQASPVKKCCANKF